MRYRAGSIVRSGASAATELASAESRLGFAIPEGVKLIYSSVANGGFGPGYGLVGIGGGQCGFHRAGRCWHCEDEFGDLRASPGAAWPPTLLPVVDWGCAVYSSVDVSTAEGAILRSFGDSFYDDPAAAIQPEGMRFAEWLCAWLDGVTLWDRALKGT